MKTAIDCLPCFLKQALYTARLATSSQEIQQRIMLAVTQYLTQPDFDRSPPENAVPLYNLIAEISGNPDPFRHLKQQSNQAAMDLRSGVSGKIRNAENKILAALKFAIAGNIIDYGSHQDFDIESTLAHCLDRDFTVNDYELFQKDLDQAGNILYLADNCGELVFDACFIEQLNNNITLAVKERPIINDACLEDARFCGIDKICRTITNGTNCPGTPPGRCSSEFEKAFQQADLIISKGQGNFETLSDQPGPIYFLLTVKCPVVAEHVQAQTGRAINVQPGDMILMRGNTEKKIEPQRHREHREHREKIAGIVFPWERLQPRFYFGFRCRLD